MSARSGDKCAETPAALRVTLPGMILTELGLHFAKEGDRWRCAEYPDLVMLRGGRYEVDGQGSNTLAGVIGQARAAGPNATP